MKKANLLLKYILKTRGYLSRDLLFRKGLFTYKLLRKDGKSIHIQLKINKNLRGILFIDLTDVIHLNKSAVLISKMILDKKSPDFAYTYIKKKFLVEKTDALREEISLISKFITHLTEEHGNCYVCDFIKYFIKQPVFSEKINAPYKIDLALTYGCNNACSHCYNENNRFGLPSFRKNDWFKVIDKLVFEGIPHLILTGGEATLHPDLPEIIEYSNKKGMVVGLNTNGRRLSDKNYMGILKEKGLNHVQFTLGSHLPEEHNQIMGAMSFEQTVTGIKNALDSGIHVITNTTIVQKNKEYLPEFIDFLFDLGIRTFAMNGLIYSGGGTEMGDAIPEFEMKIILDQVNLIALGLGMKFLWYSPTEYCRINPVQLGVGIKRCNAGEYSLCIEPNGNVLPCQSYYHATGNILIDEWEDIWRTELNTSFRNRVSDVSGVFLPDYCDGCPAVVICGGGCKIERDSKLGVEKIETLENEIITGDRSEENRFYPTKSMMIKGRASGVEKRKY